MENVSRLLKVLIVTAWAAAFVAVLPGIVSAKLTVPAAASGGGVTNSASANVIVRSNGTNLVASSCTDDLATLQCTPTGGVDFDAPSVSMESTAGAGDITIGDADDTAIISAPVLRFNHASQPWVAAALGLDFDASAAGSPTTYFRNGGAGVHSVSIDGALAVAGVSTLTGNVGIGATPSSKLWIEESAANGVSGPDTVTIWNSNASGRGGINFLNTAGSGNFYLGVGGTSLSGEFDDTPHMWTATGETFKAIHGGATDATIWSYDLNSFDVALALNVAGVSTLAGQVDVTAAPASDGALKVGSGNAQVRIGVDIAGVTEGGVICFERPDDGLCANYIGGGAAPADPFVIQNLSGVAGINLVTQAGLIRFVNSTTVANGFASSPTGIAAYIEPVTGQYVSTGDPAGSGIANALFYANPTGPEADDALFGVNGTVVDPRIDAEGSVHVGDIDNEGTSPFNGAVFLNDSVRFGSTTLTINDNGNAGTAATSTFFLNTNNGSGALNFHYTCNDAQGCDLSFGETDTLGAAIGAGMEIRIFNAGANTLTIKRAANVTEINGGTDQLLGTLDMQALCYSGSAWLGCGYANN